MILMPQIFNVTANENVRYKHSELECGFDTNLTYKAYGFEKKYMYRIFMICKIFMCILQNIKMVPCIFISQKAPLWLEYLNVIHVAYMNPVFRWKI